MRLSRRSRLVLGTVVVASLAVAGCSDGGATPEDEAIDETSAAEETGPAGPSGTIEVAGIQQTHPSGTTVAVTAITVDEAGHVYVDIQARTAGRRSAALASRTTVLEDDLGNRYEFVAPEANSTIDIAQDHEADATLAFVGPIEPDATRVTLGINGHWEDGALPMAETPARTTEPTFAFEGLPLPGVGLDDEAAGTGDASGLQLEEADIDVTGVTHEGPAQVAIEVTHIEVSPSLVTVTIEARNNSDDEKNLVQRKPELRAEQDGESLGSAFPFAFESLTTDEGEFDRLTLTPGDEATGEFAFRGVVPPQATGLRLGFQVLQAEVDKGAPNTEERAVSNPTVVFTGLPLPDRAAEVSGTADAGGDAPSDDQTDEGAEP